MKTTFKESQLPVVFCQAVSSLTSGVWMISKEDCDIITEALLMGMADLAVSVKAKDRPIAVVVDDLKGNAIFGLKLEWMEGTADIPEGSWNPTWTFNKEDLVDCQPYSVSEAKYYGPFMARAKGRGFMFYDPDQIYTLALALSQSLTKWLSDQLDTDTAVELEYPGFFTAEGHVIDGIKELVFNPSEELAALTKDDSGLQAAL